MSSSPPLSRSNPFATRFVQPGAMPFLFPRNEDAAGLVARLGSLGWRGEIVGPHGTGKSTLLATLLPELQSAGRSPRLVTLRKNQRRLPPIWTPDPPGSPPSLLVIDGYEQLSGWRRWGVQWRCRHRGWGLLVTTHRPLGLPTLYRTAVTPDLANRLVSRLLSGEVHSLEDDKVAACLARHHGNLRETLFELYDAFERRT